MLFLGEKTGSQLKVEIVSRLDFGVDEAAHKGAVEAVGRTLMVLPRGLDRVHPVSNRSFYQATIETGGGAGISSYPQGSPRRPKGRQHLAQNDRLIASLSQALVVVEAQKKSDTMSCALAASASVACFFQFEGGT